MYKITITRTMIEETITPRQWVQGGPDEANKEGTWGYTPQITDKRDITRTVLEMVVKDIEITPVVKAILDHSEQ